MRGEKIERNLRMYQDSKTQSVREIATKYGITAARVHVILSRFKRLEEQQPNRIASYLSLADQRLVSIGREVDLTLRDLRALRRLVEGVLDK